MTVRQSITICVDLTRLNILIIHQIDLKMDMYYKTGKSSNNKNASVYSFKKDTIIYALDRFNSSVKQQK